MTTVARRLLVPAAIGALITGGVAACTGSDDTGATRSDASSTRSTTPPSSPASSPSTSSPGSGEGKVPDLPEEAKAQTKEGAIAFNEWYQRQKGEALTSGDTETIDKYASKCEPCDQYADVTELNADKGIRMNVNPNRVRDVSATKRQDGGYKVTLTVDASEYHEIKADGSPGRTAEPVTYTLATNTQWSDGHWVIRDSVRVQ